MTKPALYIDIDGVLLANESNLTEGASDFIKYAADNFEAYWLTTHCMHGDPQWAIEYVNRVSEEDLTPWLNKFKPTTWSMKKTEAIDFSKPFYWFDDDLFTAEKMELEKNDALKRFVHIDLATDNQDLVKKVKKFIISYQTFG